MEYIQFAQYTIINVENELATTLAEINRIIDLVLICNNPQ